MNEVMASARSLVRRRPIQLALSAPVVAACGLAALGALLLWDGRRRAGMRHRLDEVVGSIGSGLNRVAGQAPTRPRLE